MSEAVYSSALAQAAKQGDAAAQNFLGLSTVPKGLAYSFPFALTRF